MTMTREDALDFETSDLAPGAALDALLAAVGPIVSAAASECPKAPASSVLITTAPLAMALLLQDADGRLRALLQVQQTPDPEGLAHAVAVALAGGFERLPGDAAAHAIGMVNAGVAEVALLVEPDRAVAVLIPQFLTVADSLAAAVRLFELRGVPTVH